MAFRFGYFDSEITGVDDEGMPIFDRAETSDLFALLFANLISDGVLALPSSCFRVRAAGNGLNLELDPGFGMVKGHFCFDDEVNRLTIGAAPKKYSRIDRVVMRCNYLERTVEILIKTGTEAAAPVPPELIRPAAGDYFELCLANIRLSAGQKLITQSSITDTRPDSAVCGYITQLIDHLDTSVFFAQLNAFYQEFVEKSNTSYEMFVQMASEAYKNFSDDIANYLNTLKKDSADAYSNLIDLMNNCYRDLAEKGKELHDKYREDIAEYVRQLETKGNSDLAEITQQMLDFRNTNEAEFLEWFERIKGILGTDEAGNLQNGLEGLAGRLEDVEEMLFTGMVKARLETEDGDYITDDLGNALLVDWPICQCGNKANKIGG